MGRLARAQIPFEDPNPPIGAWRFGRILGCAADHGVRPRRAASHPSTLQQRPGASRLRDRRPAIRIRPPTALAVHEASALVASVPSGRQQGPRGRFARAPHVLYHASAYSNGERGGCARDHQRAWLLLAAPLETRRHGHSTRVASTSPSGCAPTERGLRHAFGDRGESRRRPTSRLLCQARRGDVRWCGGAGVDPPGTSISSLTRVRSNRIDMAGACFSAWSE